MTTPEFIVGNGDWNQNINETLLTQLTGAAPTPDQPIRQIERHLMRMPLEALQVFLPFIPGARSADFSTQQGAVETIMGTVVENPLNQGVQDAVEDLLDRLYQIINNLRNGWLGYEIGSEVWDPFDVHVTADEMRKAFTSLQLQLQELAASGTGTTENFGTYPNGAVGPKWATWHKGLATETIAINNGSMYLLQFPLVLLNRQGWARYKERQAGSDYHRVGAVFSSQPVSSIFGGTSYNYLLARVSPNFDTPDTSAYTWGKIGANQCVIGCTTNGGTETTFASNDKFKFAPGSSYWLEAGDKAKGDPYTFRLYQDSQVILTGVDTNKKSFVGNNFRYCGLGFDNPTLQSARVSSFAMLDSK
jgi:hypothetical protein